MPTKSGKEKSVADMKEIRAAQSAYEKRKKWVKEFEPTNYTKIVLFRSVPSKKDKEGAWFKMAGHSLEIYVGKLAPRLNLKPRVTTDTDYHNKFREGIVSVRDIDGFEKRMENLKIYRDRKKSTDGIMIFNLGYEVSEEDLRVLRKADETRKKRLNDVVYTKLIAPEVNTGLLEVMRTLKFKYEKMPVTDREFLGKAMLEHARRATLYYMMAAKGAVSVESGLKTIVREVDTLQCYNSLAGEFGVMELSTCTRLLDELIKVRRIANSRATGDNGFAEEMAGTEMREKLGLNKKMR